VSGKYFAYPLYPGSFLLRPAGRIRPDYFFPKKSSLGSLGDRTKVLSTPITLGPNIPRVFFPRPLGGDPPASITGARRRNLRLARGSADSFFLRADRYLHHGPPRPHTWPRTHTTPLHATTLHSHLLPAHTAPLHSHLYFGYEQPVWHVPLGLTSVAAKDSATLHIHSTHSINSRKHPTPTPLGKVYTRALVVPPSSPHQRTFVCGASIGTVQVGVSSIHSSNSLCCIV